MARSRQLLLSSPPCAPCCLPRLCRLARAALVSKQFWRACLLLPLDVSIRPCWGMDISQRNALLLAHWHAWLLARLLALRAFLAKHAPVVRSLEFDSCSRET